MATIVNVESLQMAAVHYDPVIRHLPAIMLEEFVQKMGFKVQVGIDREDRLVLNRRKGELTRAYKGTVGSIDQQEMLKFEESVLRVEPIYLSLQDNIQNYRDRQIAYDPSGKRQINYLDKKHPAEGLILQSVVRTFSEDMRLLIWHGARKDTGFWGAFDGLNTHIDALLAAGKITTLLKKKGTGIEELENYIKALSPTMQRGQLVIYLSMGKYWEVQKDLATKMQGYQYLVKPEDIATYLQTVGQLENPPRLVTDAVYGEGDRVVITQEGNITFGLSAQADTKFIDVYRSGVDPNVVNFWIQADAGVRIDDWDYKVFAVNEGTITRPTQLLSGDYKESAGAQPGKKPNE